MIDKEYQKYIDEQPLAELKKIALRINKLHFAEEFNAVVNKIEELEGDKFDWEFYHNDKMKDSLHLEVKNTEDFEIRNKRSQRILSAFLFVFSVILSFNVYNLVVKQNLVSIIPVLTYLGLIILNINRSKIFGKVCKVWAVAVMLITLLINFKSFIGISDSAVIDLFNSLIGSNEIIQPTLILLAASILIFVYADHIIFEEEKSIHY